MFPDNPDSINKDNIAYFACVQQHFNYYRKNLVSSKEFILGLENDLRIQTKLLLSSK